MSRQFWFSWGIPLGAILLFSLLYFLPYYQGYRFRASDQFQLGYTTYPLEQQQKKTGKMPFWDLHAFSGMPTYAINYVPSGIYFPTPYNIVERILREYPPTALFVGLMGFFLLLWAEGASGVWALAGALAFILTSYYTNMIVATHWGKSNVLFTAPYVLAGIAFLHKQRWVTGIVLSLLGWAGLIGGNHPQMLYYVLWLIAGYELAWLVRAWRARRLSTYLREVGVLAGTFFFGSLSQIANLFPFYEYGKYSIRGANELEREKENPNSSTTGLDKSYAYSYSASRAEVWTIVIPDFVGGTSQEDVWKRLGRNSALYQAFQQQGISDISFLRQVPTYWGGSPFSAGSFYVSAVFFFLILLGWIYGLDAIDWALLYVSWLIILLCLGAYGYSLWASVVLLGLPALAAYVARRIDKLWLKGIIASAIFLIGWGIISLVDSDTENTYKLTDLALDYLPFYNKFRAPSTWLTILGMTIPWMGVRGVFRFLENPQKERGLMALGLTVGILVLVGWGAPLWGFSFEGAQDAALRTQANLPDWFMEALREDRIAIAQQSTLRSLLWVILTGGVLGLFLFQRINAFIAGLLIAFLVTADGWLLNSAYFPRKEIYVRKKDVPPAPPIEPYEEVILRDTLKPYRVLPLHTNPFVDSRPGAYLETVGGYHPAKLRRYQQLIGTHLSRLEPEVLRMLNVRYITMRPGASPPPAFYDSLTQSAEGVVIYRSRDTLPIAWLSPRLRVFPRIDQTLDSLGQYPVYQTTLVYEGDWKKLPFPPQEGPIAPEESVVCTHREFDEVRYKVRTRQPRLLVMSEVYYPEWKAEVNGKESPIIPVNFILRGVAVPAGESEVRLFFDSKVHKVGTALSLIGSVGAWLMIGIPLLLTLRRKNQA
ncbi:MAG: hypothetical protein NZ580_06535 [Bacteroidia bacterium]|nr:hypothetical protein [Bacteroidia bacterium]MDW8235178.1 hypothetical protein [Bacteroidia bacterium]